MADISILKNHSVNTDTLRQRLEELAQDLKQKYSIKYAWAGDTINLSGAGIKSGVVVITEKDLKIEISLGMLAKMLKPKIEEGINQKMSKLLK